MMRRWKRVLATLLLTTAAAGVSAQSLQQLGMSVTELVPKGWNCQQATGDLNKDGVGDLVIVATPDFKENTKTRDDGYVYNFNQPILAIYFGTPQGGYRLWRQYDKVIPANQDEYTSVSTELEVNNRGALRISIKFFSSMGSYGSNSSQYTYRYQNGDFYLIGMDQKELRRNTGEMTIVSENYLTWKRQVISDNAFAGKASPPEECWSKLKKKPLEKLGARLLE